MANLDTKDLDKEESLSLEVIKLLNETANSQFTESTGPRPKENLQDLLEWTKNQVKDKFLSDQTNLNCIISNDITIDGQFILFCKQNNVKITTLYKDSVLSWASPSGPEHFFAQGVFLIKSKNFEFVHASLFHKGVNYEDTVSIFIIVSEANCEKWLEFKNRFKKWQLERDRSNCLITVFDDAPIPYAKDSAWEDLFLEEKVKTNLKFVIDNFVNSKDFYMQNKIPWKKGILLFGPAGNGKTSIIRTIMSNYDAFKPVTIGSNPDDDDIKAAFDYAEEQSPALLFFEDIDSLLERIDVSAFLNLLDGVRARNGLLVIATANDIRRLKGNIVDRPSRFDSKILIPLPNELMAEQYLRHWFGKNISNSKCKQLAKLSQSHKLSYAYLKELYVSSMFEALSCKRKVIAEKDIDKAFEKIIKEKSVLNQTSININQYLKG